MQFMHNVFGPSFPYQLKLGTTPVITSSQTEHFSITVAPVVVSNVLHLMTSASNVLAPILGAMQLPNILDPLDAKLNDILVLKF